MGIKCRSKGLKAFSEMENRLTFTPLFYMIVELGDGRPSAIIIIYLSPDTEILVPRNGCFRTVSGQE